MDKLAFQITCNGRLYMIEHTLFNSDKTTVSLGALYTDLKSEENCFRSL
ncbi:MAG: hypothetical protein OSJ73_23245 [Lachnospiraceae bacterium]|nr:hypothetical protein [Lachnospiraceae bacterium]